MKKLYPEQPILLVDDEEQTLRSVKVSLRTGGLNNVVLCSDSRNVESILSTQDFEVILLDLVMPHISGDQLLPTLREKYPNIPVIIVTGMNDLNTAVSCMAAGASDYMVKPVERARLVSAVKRALATRELERENSRLREHLLNGSLARPDTFSHIVTASPAMSSIFQYIEAVATTSHPVLVTGETGVGKELVARAIHLASEREGEFVTVNVAGLDENVFADTLFGHKKGAFTGASENRDGLVHKAKEGTLFLDEMGDLDINSQIKLLRLLQEREYMPLGSDLPKQSNARIVAATNKSIDELKDCTAFRRDLFYRLRSHHIAVPPLRKRPEDIPLLLEHFNIKAANELQKKPPTYPPELATLLKTHHFPGNVRELEAMVFDAVSNHKSHILSMASFKKAIGYTKDHIEDDGSTPKTAVEFGPQLPTLKELEQMLIEEALDRADGNQSMAAKLLGISRQALNRRVRQDKKGAT
jgi:DNA-binding NtrC family response regulator